MPGVATAHLPREGVELVAGDIRNPAEVRRAVAGCCAVIHLAGNPDLFCPRAAEFEEVNHQGTRTVLAAAKEAGVERTIHVSTESIAAPLAAGAISDEDTRLSLAEMPGPYLRSKWLAEEAAREAIAAGAPVIIARPSIPVGPGDRRGGPIMRLISHFREEGISAYLPGTLDLVDVRCLATGFYAVATQGIPGRTYLLNGETPTYQEFFARLATIFAVTSPLACPLSVLVRIRLGPGVYFSQYYEDNPPGERCRRATDPPFVSLRFDANVPRAQPATPALHRRPA